MKYLFIDTATANLVVALVVNGEVKYLYNEFAGKDMSVITMSKIKEAFDCVGFGPGDLDKVFAVTGPGSFTGIRIGLTIAKTMCWSLNIPVVPISSLEVIASTNTGYNNMALIDARRGYVYAGGYDRDLNCVFSDKHILLLDIKFDGKMVSYDDICDSVLPDIDVLKVINKHKDDKGVNPHSLNPNYLKLTEAEEKLKGKND